MSEFIVSVMARDRPGIVAAVSGAVASMGGNITHLSETVLRGYFTIILSLEAGGELSADVLRGAIVASGDAGEFEVGVLPFAPEVPAEDAPAKDTFILTAHCRDRKGVIHSISRALAEAGINIDDFYAYVLDGELIMTLEIGVTHGTDLAEVRARMDDLAARAGISIHLQHQDIFRATTELQAVLRLRDRV